MFIFPCPLPNVLLKSHYVILVWQLTLKYYCSYLSDPLFCGTFLLQQPLSGYTLLSTLLLEDLCYIET